MHVAVFHHGRKWARAKNHMDARHCPECGATVHGDHGQRQHQRWHEELADILNNRAAPQLDQPVPWTAAVDEEDGHEEIA